MSDVDLTHLIRNWQFCDGSAFQHDIPQLNVPLGWTLRYPDHTPIPVVEPPVLGLRPECVPAAIWDVGGEGGKFGQSPPNPGQYNAVLKIHKGFAPFAFALAQPIGPLEIGQRYRVAAWFFPDFYDASGAAPADPYSAACGIGLDGDVAYQWPLQFGAWQTLQREFVATSDYVELSLCGFAKWGLAGNTFWLHGARLYAVEAPGAPSAPGNPALADLAQVLTRIAVAIERLAAAWE